MYVQFKLSQSLYSNQNKGPSCRDRMVVGFTTTYAISAYHHWCCEFGSRSGRGLHQYLIKFFSDLRQVGGYLLVLPFSPQIKLTADHKHKPHTQISIKDQVYIYLNTADCTQNALIQFIQKHFLFLIVGHTIQIMLL